MTKGVTMSEIRGNGETELGDRSIADLLKQLSDQTATAMSPPMPYWASTRARQAGWRRPKLVNSTLIGLDSAVVASIIR